jgi:hypothetical protein
MLSSSAVLSIACRKAVQNPHFLSSGVLSLILSVSARNSLNSFLNSGVASIASMGRFSNVSADIIELKLTEANSSFQEMVKVVNLEYKFTIKL